VQGNPDLSPYLSLMWTIAKVAMGLGFVIFVHELGHFAVAKMCGVKCEKFYVGFDVPIRIDPIRFPRTLIKFRHGETEERIYMLDAWRESLLYSESERAVLAWTEALTRVDQAGAPDHAYEALQAHFSEEEQIKITLLVAAINAFNRVNVGLRVRLPGSAGRKVA
jgi:hypothetical protein